jgi:uncharacterized protein YdeI (YjbR/CyaY-like superfamily)
MSKAFRTLRVTDRASWRQWLRKHYKTESEIWLIYFKRGSGKPRIEYNDAVEEALCFGWIDSTVKTIDDERFAQRFSPRNPRSKYSPANIERLGSLVRRGKVTKSVQATLPDLSRSRPRPAKDILNAIKASKQAWMAFQGFSDAYKRIRIGFIEGARDRPQEFTKRLNYFIRMSARNKQFGFGGIEKHY